MAKQLSTNQKMQLKWQQEHGRIKTSGSTNKASTNKSSGSKSSNKATWDPYKEMAKRREQSAAKKKQKEIEEQRKNGTYKKGESQKEIIARSSKKGTSTTGTLTKEQEQGFRTFAGYINSAYENAFGKKKGR